MNKKNYFRCYMKKEWPLHVMLIIPVVMLFIFHYIPLGGLIIAFQDYNPGKGFFRSEFVGFDKFKELMFTPNFWPSVRNTVIIALGKIILGIVVPVTFALLLNEMKAIRVKKAIQTIVYLPHFISWVLVSGIIIEILSPSNGLLNQFLGFFGVEPIFFLGQLNMFRPIIWITDVWKEFGYATIVYLAALASIDTGLYEAAAMDGAGHLRRAWHVTLPGISSTIILMSMLKLGSVLNAGFDQIFNLYSPATREVGDIIDTLVYRLGMGNGEYSLSTAAGMFKSVITSILVVVSYKLAYRFSGYRVF